MNRFWYYSVNIYLFKANSRNSRKMCEICSKLTIKTTTSTLFWCFYCQLWTYFTHFSSVSIVDFKQVNVCWVPPFQWANTCSKPKTKPCFSVSIIDFEQVFSLLWLLIDNFKPKIISNKFWVEILTP